MSPSVRVPGTRRLQRTGLVLQAVLQAVLCCGVLHVAYQTGGCCHMVGSSYMHVCVDWPACSAAACWVGHAGSASCLPMLQGMRRLWL